MPVFSTNSPEPARDIIPTGEKERPVVVANPFMAMTETRQVSSSFTVDLPGEVARLRAAGVQFRNDIVTGPGGSQILLRDPSGNLIELFQPARS